MEELLRLITGLTGKIHAQLLERLLIHGGKNHGRMRLASFQSVKLFHAGLRGGIRGGTDGQCDQDLVDVQPGIVVAEVGNLQVLNRLDNLGGDELHGIGRMYARIELPPGSYVGWHQHVDDTEPYYILKGKGIFTDNDQSKTEVGPGDVCVIEPGQFHSLENASDTEDLVFMALIYNTDMIRPEK